MTAIEKVDFVIVQPSPSKYLVFAKVLSNQIFAHPMVVMPFQNYEKFSVLKSNFHESWVHKYASTLGTGPRYTSSDVFETFPFPRDTTPLETIGETYHETRRQIMLDRREGLTATYNRFHDPDESAADIQELRDLHVEMDVQVAAAYGWDDLALEHGYHETAQGLRFTISEAARREVLTRLLKLNHDRFAEECRRGLRKTDQERQESLCRVLRQTSASQGSRFTAPGPLRLQ